MRPEWKFAVPAFPPVATMVDRLELPWDMYMALLAFFSLEGTGYLARNVLRSPTSTLKNKLPQLAIRRITA